MSTSVVIATYDTARLSDLRTAIESVRHQSVPPHEVIIAVDRNQELAALVAAEYPTLTVVTSNGHAGAGGARNAGAAVATGRYLAFMDDDAQAEPGWLAELEGALAGGEEDLIGIGGFIEPLWLVPAPRWFPPEFRWVIGCSYTGQPVTRAAVRNVISANMAMHAGLFREIGGFRSDFGKQGHRSEPEETDLCIRAGLRYPERSWMYDPAMRVLHRVPPSRLTWSYFLRRCFLEGTGKASLAGHIGSDHALREERAYVQRVLPRGVVRELRHAIRNRDPWSVARAVAIVVGAGVTAIGYLAGQLSASTARPASQS